MAYSCYSQSLVITTAYDNLGVEALIFSLNEGEVTTLFTQGDLFSVVKKIGSQVASLKNIIYCGTVSEKELQDVKSTCGFDFYSMEELEQLGRQNPVPINAAKPEDLCCIMYTSGSTGNPKGVMLTHENMIASITGGVTLLGSLFSSEDVYLGYLPLAHVLEFLIENCCIFKGVAIGYGSPRTLTDQSVRNCKGDIRELRPTVMAGVPMVWETIKKGIVEKLDHVSPSKRSLFYGAIELKKKLLVLGLPTTILDKVIFKKIAEGTGGRLRAAISGGAPIAPETQMFLTCALCPLVQGYGMTETCGMMTVQGMTELCVPNSVGSPSTACEIKLVACNNYNPNGTPPRGEVWVRGRNIMSGYYKQPKITQENITSDGWLMTGDIGEWREDGSLSIIDRKKNLVKLSHGIV
jgi:long-chain acyl-CoA synthetase